MVTVKNTLLLTTLIFSCTVCMRSQIRIDNLPLRVEIGDTLSFILISKIDDTINCYVDIWQSTSNEWIQVKTLINQRSIVIDIETDSLEICAYSRIRVRVNDYVYRTPHYFNVVDENNPLNKAIPIPNHKQIMDDFSSGLDDKSQVNLE